ncbi:MAG: hypothetical protein H6506_04830 [Calditrichaeota bacterium]|nr:hypothetical protein [Calditrichota bacterium]MCB9391960.1 hypothetical protein [Calditrichota bacterium]
MRNRKNTWIIAGIIALLVFAVGCSEISAPTMSSDADITSESTQYPPIEGVIANLESQGYRVVMTAQTALDDNDDECDTVIVDRYARVNQGGSLNLQGLVRLEWLPGIIPNDMTIEIVSPAHCLGVADFYPHPTQFNGYLNIVWDIGALDLPDDFDFDNLVPLYIHDDGTVEEVMHQWRGGHNELVVQTNHFSRYIITSRLLF